MVQALLGQARIWAGAKRGSIRKSQVRIRISRVRIRKSPVSIRVDAASIRKSREQTHSRDLRSVLNPCEFPMVPPAPGSVQPVTLNPEGEEARCQEHGKSSSCLKRRQSQHFSHLR